MIKIKFTGMVNVLFISTILFAISSPLFAEAPVYDADALEQPYDSASNEQMQPDLPPPPSQANQESAFVPIQSEIQQPPPVPSSRGGLERRLQRVEQQIDNMQGNNLSVQVESLQNQIQALRAEVEQVTHALREAQKTQKNMFANFEQRLSQVAGEPDKASTSLAKEETPKVIAKSKNRLASAKPVEKNVPHNRPANDAANQPDVAEEQQIYQNAYNMIKAKKYNDAVNILQNMLQKYPSGQFASNAHYWLGELYGLLGKNDKALSEFDQVVTNFSDSPRVSDAMLKVGIIFAAQSKWADAKTIFNKVVNTYPGSASSRLASEQLKQIKQAGH